MRATWSPFGDNTMATPTTVGTSTGVASGIVMQPDVDWTIAEKISCKIIYTGPYSDCLTAALGGTFVRGASTTIDGVTDMVIDKINLKKRPGGRGVITIDYAKPVSEPSEGAGGYSEEDPKWECDWNQIEKKIEAHPRYTKAENLDGTSAVTGTDTAIDAAGFAFVRGYFEADAEARLAMYNPADGSGTINDFGTPKTMMIELITKKLKGIDSFIIYAPVIRGVSQCNGIPASTNCGLRVAPPAAAAAPAGYEYLQTADRTAPNGPSRKFTRTIEFTGADEVDHDLYPAAP